MEAEFYTPETLAKKLMVSTETIYRLVRHKKIGFFRVGKQIRFTKGEVNLFIHQQTIPKEKPKPLHIRVVRR